MKQFSAPWGASLIITSALGTALCLGIATVIAFELNTSAADQRLLWACVVPVAIIAGCALFAIRGYIIAPGAVYIQRLLWTTRLPMYGLQSASFEPHAMRWSIRTFGNGGLFSFAGRYWNRTLGSYRAFVTDPKRTVVLRFPDRTIVLSPGLPEQFVYDLASTPASQ